MADTLANIRTATRHDIDAIEDLHRDAWSAGYGHLFPADLLARAIEKHCTRWPSVFERSDFSETTLSVAEDDVPEIIAFAHFGPGSLDAGRFGTPKLDEIIEIYSFYVHPSRWGTGVATLLMRHVVDAAARTGCEAIRLTTYAGVSRARRFYEKAGFIQTGGTSEYDLLGEVLVPEVEYALTLKPLTSAG